MVNMIAITIMFNAPISAKYPHLLNSLGSHVLFHAPRNMSSAKFAPFGETGERSIDHVEPLHTAPIVSVTFFAAESV